MKVGVFGANGFVGRNMCSKFLEYKAHVIALYNRHQSSIPDGCIKIPYSKYKEYHFDILIIAIGGHDSDYQQFLAQNRLINDIVETSNFDKIIFIFFITNLLTFLLRQNLTVVLSIFHIQSLVLSKVDTI